MLRPSHSRYGNQIAEQVIHLCFLVRMFPLMDEDCRALLANYYFFLALKKRLDQRASGGPASTCKGHQTSDPRQWRGQQMAQTADPRMGRESSEWKRHPGAICPNIGTRCLSRFNANTYQGQYVCFQV